MSLERSVAEDPYAKLPPVASMRLRSDDLRDGEPMPARHAHPSAGGEDVSPHLAWEGAPEGTRSFVVTCFDPDAPTPCGFWHWALVDLPGDVHELARGAAAAGGRLPAGAFHVRSDMGPAAYAGAAPPPDDVSHRYYFVVHAVDVASLGVDPDVTPAVVSFNLAFHTLARGQLVATHQI